jgi:hypothetical protein
VLTAFRRRWCPVAAGALLLTAQVLGQRKDDPEAALLNLLATYDAGKYDIVERILESRPKAELTAAIRKFGDRWIATGPAETRDRRRLVAGAVALEIVAAGLRDEWKDVVEAVEWACKHVTATPPGSDAELTWHIGSVAVLQDGAGMMRMRSFAGDHVEKHSLKRFPDSPRLRLAFAVDEERGVSRPITRPGLPEVSFEATRLFRMGAENVVNRYTALMASESVAEEARLRLGAFYFRTGSIDDALSQLTPLTRSADLFTGYVSAFLVGEAHRGQGRHRDAIEAYRLALTHVPNGMSASLGLSVSLAAMDDMTGALAAISGASLPSAPIDPWRIFAYGEGRHWVSWRDLLRKELKR